MLRRIQWLLSSLVLVVAACGGGGSVGGEPTPAHPPASNILPTVNAGSDQSLDEGASGHLAGSGSDAEGPVTYAWTQVSGPAITLSSATVAQPSFTTPLIASATAAAVMQLTVRDSTGATATDTVTITIRDVVPSGAGATYLKASNAAAGHKFGQSIAISADGSTMAVGAPYETPVSGGGGVYVYVRVAGAWQQQALLKIPNSDLLDQFGFSVALSADGNTLAIGARDEGSNATGINGDRVNNAASNSGAVYVFTRTGAAWSEQAYVKASNTGAGDWFGSSVALSADGNTLAVGAFNEGSNATGINGDQSNNLALSSGAAYVYTRSGTTWSQQAYVKASTTSEYFGYALALSADGNTLAVGAYGGRYPDGGAAYIFVREPSGQWGQQIRIAAPVVHSGYFAVFGWSVALSADGNTLAVGSPGDTSDATGVGGDPSKVVAPSSGAVFVFSRQTMVWSQQAYVKATNTGEQDRFGSSVALSASGDLLAVGAPQEDSPATGIGGDQSLDTAFNSGAVYVYARSAGAWSSQKYVKATNTGATDTFGMQVALSGDGSTLAVSAPEEDSAARGIGGNQADNSAAGSGAVYLY